MRQVLDPVQFGLIQAHVTLCRDDELEGLDPAMVQRRLEANGVKPITLAFGQAERFSTHGVLLPCIAGEDEFQALRQLILGSETIRRQPPHITLAHPRNPKSPGNSLAAAANIGAEVRIRFTTVCRIQQDAGAPWQVLQRFALAAAEDSDA